MGILAAVVARLSIQLVVLFVVVLLLLLRVLELINEAWSGYVTSLGDG